MSQLFIIDGSYYIKLLEKSVFLFSTWAKINVHTFIQSYIYQMALYVGELLSV